LLVVTRLQTRRSFMLRLEVVEVGLLLIVAV
jgi:hypothetical protein